LNERIKTSRSRFYDVKTLEKTNLWKMNAKAKPSALFFEYAGPKTPQRNGKLERIFQKPLWPNSSHVE
jgi:hypothetical protein